MELPFVRAVRLIGSNQWRISLRLEPNGQWLAEHVTSGSVREIQEMITSINRKRSIAHGKRARQEQIERQEQIHKAAGPGLTPGHKIGPISKCPVCREQMWKQTSKKRPT